ncbi:ATP-binding protein [Streptomyces sp. XM4193]|uniref:ATP-binding protein n=1 Tax=Streptomyces sp. XM4193 TaxID=2929782 RepID=UPI001FF820B2|nr:ATP-binding protein [Streptomyces sp. XM4193]MCK1797025.1 ATP-binding protein [Streptomyces sp. XM4193]
MSLVTASGPESSSSVLPQVTELRLSAFRGARRVRVPMSGLTLVTGPAGSGRSTVVEAYEALSRLAAGESLRQVFGTAEGGPSSYVPRSAGPDELGRRGFRIGVTVTGPVGEVRLDLAVQAEPSLRVVGERLSDHSRVLLSTALRDPRRPVVQAEWHTAGVKAVTSGPLPDDRLATPVLPLRVAGSTQGQRQVLAAAEQTVRALRAAFVCAPRPSLMRTAAPVGESRLRSSCENIAAVLRRTRGECESHAELAALLSEICTGPRVEDLVTELSAGPTTEAEPGLVRAVLERGAAGRTPLDALSDAELRCVAQAFVLLTGSRALLDDSMRSGRSVREAAQQPLVVLADDLDLGLEPHHARELLALARRMGEEGHVRLLATMEDAALADTVDGASVVKLGGVPVPAGGTPGG